MPESARQFHGGVAAAILAAGAGRRMESERPKQLLELGGIPLYLHSLEFFLTLEEIDHVCLVLRANDVAGEAAAAAKALARRHERELTVTSGGERRQDSAAAALRALPPNTEIVLIHDAARPFPPREPALTSIAAARETGGAILAVPSSDTVKQTVPGDDIIDRTLDRSRLWLAQTPQTFQYALLRNALESAQRDGVELTDEAMALERLGKKVRLIRSTVDNLKVTVMEDLARAERILAARREMASS